MSAMSQGLLGAILEAAYHKSSSDSSLFVNYSQPKKKKRYSYLNGMYSLFLYWFMRSGEILEVDGESQYTW